jgi:hypothetical protein
MALLYGLRWFTSLSLYRSRSSGKRQVDLGVGDGDGDPRGDHTDPRVDRDGGSGGGSRCHGGILTEP